MADWHPDWRERMTALESERENARARRLAALADLLAEQLDDRDALNDHEAATLRDAADVVAELRKVW